MHVYKDCLELRSVLFYMACRHCFQDGNASHSKSIERYFLHENKYNLQNHTTLALTK